MKKFFRLFGSYRSMMAEFDDAIHRRTVAEDEVRYWRGKAEVWEAEAQRAQAEKDTSHRALIDWCAMRLTGMPIFGTTPPLPKEPLPSDRPPAGPTGGKRLARDVVNQITSQFESDLEDYYANKT